jgi:hypothetical protein
MIRKLMVWIGAAAFATGWVTPARCEPLQFEHVPAGAKWVAHIDADAARSSKVMATVLKECLKVGDVAENSETSHTKPWAAVKLEKLRGVTLYGSRLGLRHGVAVVYGECDRKELLAKLKEKVDVKASGAGDREVYTWTKHKGTDLAHEVALAFPSDGVMVLASGSDELAKALDVIAGKGANLTSIKSPLSKKAPDGAILIARAEGLEDADIGPRLKFFRLIRGFDYVAAESGGKWKEELAVTADTEAVAEDLRKVMDGLLAVTALYFHEYPKLVAMIKDSRVERTGATARVSYEGSVSDVVSQIGPACEALGAELESRMRFVRDLLGDCAQGDSPGKTDR